MLGLTRVFDTCDLGMHAFGQICTKLFFLKSIGVFDNVQNILMCTNGDTDFFKVEVTSDKS